MTQASDVAPAKQGAVPALRLRNLTGRYNKTVAVECLDLDVAAGEFLTLLGPSGSGKTTTLRLIAGLLQPASGSIELGGKDVTSIPPYRRDIGVVFQNYALFPHMTAGQNVAFPLEMRHLPKGDSVNRVRRAFSLVRLDGFEDRYPRQLSGGQQQRVALARALVFEPKVLLMDEPLGALDKKLRDQLQLEIKRIHEELHITVVYVTHDQEEALVLSDRVAIFNDGKIAQLGSPRNIYRRPASMFVADFIGEANVLPGSLHRRNGDLWIDTQCGSFRTPADSSLPIGESALVVRPERLHLVREGDGTLDDRFNAVHCTIKAVTYLGAVVKYSIAAGPVSMTARVEAPDDAHIWGLGDNVVATWRIDDSVLVSDFPADSIARS